MKLRCPYCRTVFTKLDAPTCPGCGKTLRIAWETDLKTPGTRAAFRISRGKRPEPPRQRAKMPPKPPAMMIPWLLFSYRSRIFMGALIL